MKIQGALSKMVSQLTDIVHYQLPVGETLIEMNELIGKKIQMNFTHQINCIICGAKTKKSFAQGFCYKCFSTHPAADECIFNPEKCMAHNGISRDMAWSEEHCLQPHIVYLSVTNDIKVGVTRLSQIPTRWIDQGAIQAIRLAQTPNRYTAGIIEVALKPFFADKTNWQRMLKNQTEPNINLIDKKQYAWEMLSPDLQLYVVDDDQITHINYPVQTYPKKLNSVSWDKTAEINGVLTGIKGQYLIFDHQNVINIRKFGGYTIEFSVV